MLTDSKSDLFASHASGCVHSELKKLCYFYFLRYLWCLLNDIYNLF